MIDAIELRRLLSYNPHTGVFRWRDTAAPRVAGKVAGYVHQSGYNRIKLLGREYTATHLVWLYHTGYFPRDGYEIDHINNIRTDDRLSNLREVTHWQNQQNRIDTKRNGGLYEGSIRQKQTKSDWYQKNREKHCARMRELYWKNKAKNDNDA